jgi:hypothetical protein
MIGCSEGKSMGGDCGSKSRNRSAYHDGKWLALPVDRDELLDDIEKLLTVKRKPMGK